MFVHRTLRIYGIQCVILQWLPVGIRGMLGCIPVAAYGFGSVIWVPLQTAFANPDNIEVQAVEGEDDL